MVVDPINSTTVGLVINSPAVDGITIVEDEDRLNMVEVNDYRGRG